MSRKTVALLSKEEKQKIVDYYLYPHSYIDTSVYFNLDNVRYDLDYILSEFNVVHHSTDVNRKLNNKTTTCIYCGKAIRNCNLSRHLLGHQQHPEKYDDNKPSYKLTHDGLCCQYCGKECKNRNSLCNHERLCKNNPAKILQPFNGDNFAEYRKTYGSWCKGLTKETDERIRKQAETYKARVQSGEIKPSFEGRHLTDEHKAKISNALLQYNHSNTPRNLHSKGGWYKGVYFMSTWELAYYIYNVDLGKSVIRCQERFIYEWQEKQHYYTPDFIIDNCYIEIKGKEWPKDLVKYQAVRDSGSNIKIIYNVDEEVKYVLNKFNIKKITELYEN